MLEIRKAHVDDASFIALLGRITFTETFGHLFRYKEDLTDYFNETFSVEKMAMGLQKAENIFWIAFEDKLPVGYAKLKLYSKSPFLDSENVCQLQKIYVLKDFLSQKVGLKLQYELLAEAQKRKFEQIWLSVLHSNERAIQFYAKNGFREIGKHDFQIGRENFHFLAMAKDL